MSSTIHTPPLTPAMRLTLCALLVAATMAMPATAHATESDDFPAAEATDAAELQFGGDGSDADATRPDEDDAMAAAETEAALGPPPPDDIARPFLLLGGTVPPGTTRQLGWYAGDSFTGSPEPTPVIVANGSQPGKVLCITAAIHGDELNGVEIARQLLYDIDPERLKGTVIGVPIVNIHGFRQGSRYLPDRRDLNRHFPGHPRGSAASRIAHSLFDSVIRHCDALVDLHTGSFHRTNLPQIRADLSIPDVAHLTKGFGATAVLNGSGPSGSIRRAATDVGIPAITLEAGEPMRFQPDEVNHGVRALRSLLNHLGMVSRFRMWGEPQPVYYESHWVRSDHGGILVSGVSLGQQVSEGQVLGTVTDPITSHRNQVRSPYAGRVLGMALNQVVIPGFAAYHIGIERTEQQLTAPLPERRPDDDGAAGEEDAPHVDDEAHRTTGPQQDAPVEPAELHLD